MTKVYCVQPDGRRWTEWLGLPDVKELQRTNYLIHSAHYKADGNHLVLVHGASHDEQEFSKLDDSAKKKVWVLLCSGTGFLAEHSKESHVHYLRYPVPRDTLGTPEIACFKNAIALLGRSTDPSPTEVWSAFYPPDNVALVALFALLCAEDRVNVSDSVHQFAIGEDGRTAYLQYCRASALYSSTGGAGWEYAQWLTELRQPSHHRLRTELQKVLGLVPD